MNLFQFEAAVSKLGRKKTVTGKTTDSGKTDEVKLKAVLIGFPGFWALTPVSGETKNLPMTLKVRFKGKEVTIERCSPSTRHYDLKSLADLARRLRLRLTTPEAVAAMCSGGPRPN